MENRILFLDDEEPAHNSFRAEISKLYPSSQVKYCFNKQDVEDAIKNEYFDVFFLDQRLKEGQLGTEIAKTIKNKQPNSYIVMATAFGLESAEEAIRAQVFSDFVSKSENDEFKALELVFNRFEAFRKQQIEISNLKNENTQLKNELKHKNKLLQDFDKKAQSSVSADTRFESLERNIIGQSAEINRVKYFIKKYAETDDNVLIIGETGTGKDLVAEAIHKLSRRRNKPFIPINCASIPEELMESELFGHTRDAFTGASVARVGKFEEANGGTVFLDEIDRMSLKAQAKILRFLEDKRVIRLGQQDNQGTIVDIRVIAAIKPKAINTIGEKFLEDLYGRLQSLFPVVPPLNERKNDIPLLVDYFIDLIGYNSVLTYKGGEKGKLNEKQYPFSKYISDYNEKKLFCFDKDGIRLITNYEWKRNVRELRKFIENIYSVFIENKKYWGNQIVPVDDVKRAFIFHNIEIPITEDGKKILDEKYSNKTIIKINQDDNSPKEYNDIPDAKRKAIENRLGIFLLAASQCKENSEEISAINMIKYFEPINNDNTLLSENGIFKIEDLTKNSNQIGTFMKANAVFIASIMDNSSMKYQILEQLLPYKNNVAKYRTKL